MPELPEVQAVVDSIKPLFLSRKIIEIKNPNSYESVFATHSLEKLNGLVINKRIKNVFRKGKYILIELESGYLAVHLRMTGNFKTSSDNESDAKHISVEFILDNKKSIYYKDYRKFGRIYYFNDLNYLENKLGCEPLSKDFDYQFLKHGLSKSNSMIKSKLLDQSFIAGLGNIYVDESLWLAKIHPEKKSDTISGIKIRRLSDAIPMILKKAIEHNGTTIINFSFGNDSIGSYKEKLNVFGKTGEVCIRCKKSKIVKIFVSQRGTHFCPRCQKK